MLRMYDVVGNPLSGIKSMCDNSSACVRIKGGGSEQFRIDSGVRQGRIMSPFLFMVYMDGVMQEVKMGFRRGGLNFMEDGREWRFPILLYADDLVLCGESKEDLRVMILLFAEVCRRKGLKV